jgi:MFS-type transporter involved in bile tolerance (Atg22 family)
MALFGFGIETEFSESFKHVLYPLFVLLLIGRVDLYIIKVANSEVINVRP